MNEEDEITHVHKPQFILTVLSKEELDENIYEEISKAIGERIHLDKRTSFDKITHTHRYIFNSSPVDLEGSKRRIWGLAQRHKSDLIVFFDLVKTFGVRKLLVQIQIILDKIIGFILPTKATIIFQMDDKQKVENIRKSLEATISGNNTISKLKKSQIGIRLDSKFLNQ